MSETVLNSRLVGNGSPEKTRISLRTSGRCPSAFRVSRIEKKATEAKQRNQCPAAAQKTSQLQGKKLRVCAAAARILHPQSQPPSASYHTTLILRRPGPSDAGLKVFTGRTIRDSSFIIRDSLACTNPAPLRLLRVIALLVVQFRG